MPDPVRPCFFGNLNDSKEGCSSAQIFFGRRYVCLLFIPLAFREAYEVSRFETIEGDLNLNARTPNSIDQGGLTPGPTVQTMAPPSITPSLLSLTAQRTKA